jgi:hypothetical protein
VPAPAKPPDPATAPASRRPKPQAHSPARRRHIPAGRAPAQRQAALLRAAEQLTAVDPRASWGGVRRRLAAADRAVLSSLQVAAFLLAGIREGLTARPEGWVEDDLAQKAPGGATHPAAVLGGLPASTRAALSYLADFFNTAVQQSPPENPAKQ